MDFRAIFVDGKTTWKIVGLTVVLGLALFLSFYYIPDVSLLLKAIFDTSIMLLLFVLADKFIFWKWDTYDEIIVKKNPAYAGVLIAIAIIISGAFKQL